jgi:hypothetical protein
MSSNGGGGDTIEARTNRDLEKMIKEVSVGGGVGRQLARRDEGIEG